MSTVNDLKPHLVLCCDETTLKKISADDELESLRYQLKILKEQLFPQVTKNNSPEEASKFSAKYVLLKLHLEKVGFLLQEKEKNIESLQEFFDPKFNVKNI